MGKENPAANDEVRQARLVYLLLQLLKAVNKEKHRTKVWAVFIRSPTYCGFETESTISVAPDRGGIVKGKR